MARGLGTTTKAKGGDGRTLEPNDNQKAKDEAEAVQLISYVSKLQGYDKQIAEQMEVVRGLREERSSIVNLAKAAGFKKYELQDIIDDLRKPRRDIAKVEERRAKLRAYYGLPAGKPEQQDMLPETAKDALFWRAAGYTAGLQGDSCEPPECGVHSQVWMEGWGDGQRVLAMALKPKEPERPGGEIDPFEATPDELKDQITRQNIKAAKESLDALGTGEPDDEASGAEAEAV